MKKSYKLENLGCPSCAVHMEDRIKEIDGVEKVNINFMTAKLKLYIDDEKKENLESIVDKAQEEITKIERDCEIVR